MNEKTKYDILLIWTMIDNRCDANGSKGVKNVDPFELVDPVYNETYASILSKADSASKYYVVLSDLYVHLKRIGESDE